MSDPLRKQIDEPEAEQIDQECPAEQIDEPDPTPRRQQHQSKRYHLTTEID